MNKDMIKEKVMTALKIREEIQNIYKKHNVSTVLSTDGVNPFSDQTDENTEGFICEYYYSSPSKIYTPLGHITITTNYMCMDETAENAIKEIEEKFGFTLKREAVTNYHGVFGGWYHITKLPWNNNDLKCDCNKRNKKDYIEYDEANELYKQIVSNSHYSR